MRLIRLDRLVTSFIAAAIAGLTFACTQTSLTGPDQSAPKCQVGVTAPQNALAPGGGNGTIAIVAAPECQWTATAAEPWITNLTPASGQGPGQLAFTVGANPAAATRQGDITVNGTAARVTQEPAPCTFDVTPRTLTVASTAGTGSVNVTTPIGCTWTSASEASWLTITSPGQRTSGGPVTFDFQENAVALPRIGSMTIAGLAVLVTQQAPGCTYVLTPPTQNIVVGGGNGSVAVTAGQGCAWTAVSDVPWLTINGSPNGSGTGAVNFTATTNMGSPRTGHITVAGTVATITQDGVASCQFSINPDNTNVGAGGGPGSTALTATAGCSWNVNSNASWITLTSPATGVGSTSVTFNVGSNSGAARQGTLSVAGRTFTVNQAAAPCTFNVDPTSQTVSNVAGSAVVGVTTASHCSWTATRHVDDTWLEIVGGANVTGSGAVSINVQGHTGTTSRQGRLTIANQPVTITQTGCSYSLSANSATVPGLGGTVSPSITVTTQAGCPWTAAQNPPHTWIGTTSGPNFTGPGTVTLTADLNPDVFSGRVGTFTIANEVVTVSQAALVCSYSINPTSTLPAIAGGGGSGFFDVTVTPNIPLCTWAASTSDTWVTLTPPTSGAGNGRVNFTVASNPGAARTGSISIPGAPAFTVNQEAFPQSSCTFTMTPPNATVPVDAGNGGNVQVDTQAACNWNASTGDAWLHPSPGTKTGSGTFSWTYDANNGPQRMGSISVQGTVFQVTQSACNYGVASIGGPPPPFTAVGGSGSIAVTTGTACPWTATVTPGETWITVTSNPAGPGSATVGYTVEPNGTGIQRTADITIAGQAVNIIQEP